MAETVTAREAKYAATIQKISSSDAVVSGTDFLAVEEPLEIRLGYEKAGKPIHRAVSITMRTPGSDFDLAAGFLFTEGILSYPEQIAAVKHCGRFPSRQNTVRVDLAAGVPVSLDKLERNFYTTSSCGVCGKSSLDALHVAGATKIERTDQTLVGIETIRALPGKLRERQSVFDETGGLHAAALFDSSGELLALREDVGRHNAVDKLIGAQFRAGRLPLAESILFLSGRASFELVQKAVMAQIPVVCAVGAPSSLAVTAAARFGVTLLGFVRDGRFNIYTGGERIDF